MNNSQTAERKKLKGWIGHKSWIVEPFTGVDSLGTQFGLLYKTKKDAMLGGWSHPRRVEISLRLL